MPHIFVYSSREKQELQNGGRSVLETDCSSKVSLPFRAPGVCFRDGLASQTIRRLQYKVYQGSCLNHLPQQTSTALMHAHAHACQNSLQPQNIYVDSKTSLAAATGRCL